MNNIVIVEGILSGAPTVRGRRLSVFNVVAKIYYERCLKEALEDYEISLDIAKDAISYCKNMDCQTDSYLKKFCDGCILRTLQDGWDFNKEEFKEIQISENSITINKNNKNVFLGSLQELEDQNFGLVGWLMAEKIEEKYVELKK